MHLENFPTLRTTHRIVRRIGFFSLILLLPAISLAAEPSADATPERPITEVAKDEIAGIVTDESGQPIAHARVDAWHWYPGNETTTNERGEFRLSGFDRRQKVEILITHKGYAPKYFPMRPTGVSDWGVVLDRETFLEGTITDADGQPVPDAVIRASYGPIHADGVLISELTTTGKSQSDGTYRIYVAPQTYDIQVSAKGHGVYRNTHVSIQENEAKSLPIQLEAGVHFEVHVVDSISGEPVAGLVLYQWRGQKLKARSDADGQMTFEDLIPGKIEFQVGGGEPIKTDSGFTYYLSGPFGRWWSPDAIHPWQRKSIDDQATKWQRNFDGLEFQLTPGMKPVTIVVEQGVTVSGQVTDPKGNPVAEATVAPARTGSGNSITGDTRYSVKTDKQGNYRVVLPASNEAVYNLIVHDGDYQEWRHWANGVSETMTTTPGQTIENFDLQLTEPAIVRGRVLQDGKPVAAREVRTHAFDKRENRYYDPTTRTDDEGRFELKYVRPGKHYLQVEPFWLSAEEAPGGSRIIEVKAGETLDGVELHPANR